MYCDAADPFIEDGWEMLALVARYTLYVRHGYRSVCNAVANLDAMFA